MAEPPDDPTNRELLEAITALKAENAKLGTPHETEIYVR
jgi:hypothetical protein